MIDANSQLQNNGQAQAKRVEEGDLNVLEDFRAQEEEEEEKENEEDELLYDKDSEKYLVLNIIV